MVYAVSFTDISDQPFSKYYIHGMTLK